MYAHFDWYSAGIWAKPDHVVGQIASRFDLSEVQHSRPMHGYSDGLRVARGDETLCTMWWGGSGGDRVLATATGAHAHEFAGIVRSEFPAHLVVRADSAVDIVDSEAWDTLFRLGLQVADSHRLKVRHQGDYYRGEDGRTLYLGSKTSEVQARIYEKGRQLQGDPNWVRAELQVRVKNESARQILCEQKPESFWGVTKWSQDFASVLFGEFVDRIKTSRPWHPTDDERAFSFLVRQYGPMLSRMAETEGWDAVLTRLRREIGGA